MTASIYDQTTCTLGEGLLWHPTRGELFWFDIEKKRLHAKGQFWQFGEHVSAAGWISENTLFMASETALSVFSLMTGASKKLAALEADNPATRSNDGRADPQGGFWIGTMGKSAEPEAGAIYRFYKGELRKLYDKITISNAICFAPDGTTAYFCDTPKRKIMKQRLDEAGWPKGDPELFVDTGKFAPDGAVVDAGGTLWNAQWGAARVAGYAPDGTFIRAYPQPADHVTCPAFGGAALSDLYCTSSTQDIAAHLLDKAPHGQTFVTPTDLTGQPEHQILL